MKKSRRLVQIILSLENIEPLIQPLKALRNIAKRLKSQLKNVSSSEVASIEYLKQSGLVESPQICQTEVERRYTYISSNSWSLRINLSH